MAGFVKGLMVRTATQCPTCGRAYDAQHPNPKKRPLSAKDLEAGMQKILQEAASEAGVSPRDVLGPSRRLMHTIPRHKAIKRMADELGASPYDIAYVMGRDRSTIRHALRLTTSSRRSQPWWGQHHV